MREPEHHDYRVMTPRRRLLLAALAIAMAAAVVLTLVGPPGASKTPRPQVPECSASQTQDQARDCVGGKAEVIYVPLQPTSPSASAPPLR
jgi:hypothetical protein